MEVIIYDGPPSIGTSLWVGKKIGQLSGSDTKIITEFVRIQAFQDLEYPNKKVLAESRDAFMRDIKQAEADNRRTIIFDGSPITHIALEHLQTGLISTKSRKAAIRYMQEVSQKTSVVILKPLEWFQTVNNMRSFNPQLIVPFGDSIEIAYRELGYDPTVVEVENSPYIDLNYGELRRQLFRQKNHSTNRFGD